MFSRRRYISSCKFFLGSFLLLSHSVALGSNSNFSSYVFGNVGPEILVSFSKPGLKKFAWKGDRIFAGIGSLYNPTKVDGWLISPELIGHYSFTQKERGGFLGAKVSFPVSDGAHYFVSGALGPLLGASLERKAVKPSAEETDANTSEKREETSSDGWKFPKWMKEFQLSSLIRVGYVNHMRNGSHFTAQLNYLRPSAFSTKQHCLSITFGVEINLS